MNFWNRCFQGTRQNTHLANIYSSPCAPLLFTPVHNRTALCPVPLYDPSTMTPACCCRGQARCEHSGWEGRAAAARGGRRNTRPFLVRGVPPRAAAQSVPWGTPVESGRTHHSPPPSSLCHSSRRPGGKVRSVYWASLILWSEATRDGTALQGHCYWAWWLNPVGVHIVSSLTLCFLPAKRQWNCSCRNNMGPISSTN